MNKRRMLVAVCLIAMLILSGCGASKTADTGTAQETYTLSMTHEVSTTHWKNLLMEQFAKDIEQKTNGRVKAKVYPAGQLYTDKDAVQALGTGSVQMVWPVSVNAEQINQAYGIVSLPFALNDDLILKDPKYRADIMNILSPQIDKERIKVMGLLRADSAVYVFKSKNAKTPEDIKNLKIRVTGGQATLDWLKDLNLTAVSMSASEMTTALSQGMIDGILTSSDGWANIIGSVGKTGLLVPQFQILSYSVLVDAKWFNSLPKDIQQIVTETMDKLAASQWQDSIKLADESYAKVKKDFNGTLYTVPNSDLNQWSQLVKPSIERFSQKYPDIYKQWVDLNKKYGLQWPM